MNIFYYESKFKIKQIFGRRGGGRGGGGTRVSEFFSQRIQI